MDGGISERFYRPIQDGELVDEDEPFAFNPAVNRLYPVAGGVLTSMRASMDERNAGDYRQLYVHGLHDCIELCKDLEAGSIHRCVIEMNICDNGCSS